MKKPKMKRAVAISHKGLEYGIIYFYANETIAECAREFGCVELRQGMSWRMEVDARYDFDEVVAWLESFN